MDERKALREIMSTIERHRDGPYQYLIPPEDAVHIYMIAVEALTSEDIKAHLRPQYDRIEENTRRING